MTTRSKRWGWHWLRPVISILAMGVGMNAVEAVGAVTWKEEVLLHDGRKFPGNSQSQTSGEAATRNEGDWRMAA